VHDRKASDTRVKLGDKVFVYMPATKTGPAYKLAQPYKGPYRVVKNYDNGVELQSVEHPRAKSIRVALSRVRKCPTAISDKEVIVLSPAADEDDGSTDNPEDDGSTDNPCRDEKINCWSKRLRPHNLRASAS